MRRDVIKYGEIERIVAETLSELENTFGMDILTIDYRLFDHIVDNIYKRMNGDNAQKL